MRSRLVKIFHNNDIHSRSVPVVPLRLQWRSFYSRGLILFYFILTTIFSLATAFSQAPEIDANTTIEQPRLPAFVVVVLSLEEGETQAAITFSQKIAEEELRNRIEEMATKHTWELSEITINDSPGPNKEILTTASFNCEGIVDRENGKLGLPPLIEAFGDKGDFRAAFVIADFANFSGPFSYSEEGFHITFSRNGDLYEYRISYEETVEATDSSAQGADSTASRRGVWLRILGIIFGIVILVSLGVVILLLWYGRKKRSQ